MSYSIRAALCAVVVAFAGEGCDSMATDLTLRAAGLYTDPNPHSDAPAGALRTADNVVIRRAGVLEPRPGFRPEGVEGSNRYVGLHPAPTGDTSEFYSQTTGGLDDDSGTAITLSGEYAGVAITQPGEYAGASAAKAFDALYIPSWGGGGVARVRNGVAQRAGLPRPQTPELTVGVADSGNWIATASSVAYRVTLAAYVGDRLIVSAPSGYIFTTNATGSTASVSVRVSFAEAPAVQAGWFIQVYRSPVVASTVVPSDEMALVQEYEVTSADVAAGFADILDQSTIAGASLYTNATQQGALQENGRPPSCKVLESFNDMLFFGNVREAQRLVLSFGLDVSDQVQTGGLADFAIADATVVRTSGGFPSQDYSADLYMVNNGEYVNSVAGTTVDAYTWIDTLGSTWEMSQNAKATANAAWDSVFWAWIYTDAGITPADYTEYYWYASGESQAVNLGAGELRSNARGMEQWAWSIARREAVTASVLDGAAAAGGAAVGQKSILLERDSYVGGLSPSESFSVRLPRSFQRYIDASTPVFNASGGTGDEAPAIEYLSVAEERVNRVFYSKKQEPEHVPPVNFIDIGADSEPILAMRATRRALFVFKTDGIWTISGDTPETLRVEQIDSTARLLHPKAVTVGGDRVFAWTDAGVVMLSEGGVAANLSAPAIEPDLRAIQITLQATTDPATGSCYGAFLRYQDGEERLLLGVPSSAASASAASVYQYDMRTQAWTRWTSGRQYSDAATIGGRILFAGLDASVTGEVWRETLASDEAPFADDAVTDAIVSASTAAGVSTVELAGVATDWPVGTWCYQPNPLGGARGVVIESDTDTDTIRVAMMEGSIGAVGDYSPLQGYQPVEQCIEWIAKTAQVPTVTKHWQRGVLTYESDRRMYDAALSFRSDMIHTPASVTTEHTLHDDALPEDIPFLTTRDHARAAILFPKLCISQGGAQWALSALHLDYELGSSRAGRRAR